MAVRSVIERTWGPSPLCARWSWTSVVRPALTYGSIVWSRVASQKWLITKLKPLQRLALSQVAHVRPGTPSTALEIMYGVPPLELHIKNCAQNAAIRVQPDTSWQPPVLPKARVGHEKYLEHSFPQGLWQADTDEIPKENTWGRDKQWPSPPKRLTSFPMATMMHIPMVPSWQDDRAPALLCSETEHTSAHLEETQNRPQCSNHKCWPSRQLQTCS
jgi:hypothetical protein